MSPVPQFARTAWLAGVWLLAAIGLAMALAFVSWSTAAMVFATVAALTGSLYVTIALGVQSLTTTMVLEGIGWAVWAGAGVVAIVGYGASIGLATLGLVAIIAATSPPALALLGSARRPAVQKPPHLSDLSDEDLCTGWRNSMMLLDKCSTTADIYAVAELRRLYLLELERRRPEAFSLWLDTTPAADTDPTPFFRRP